MVNECPVGDRPSTGGDLRRQDQGVALDAADAFLDVQIVLVLAEIVLVAVDAHFIRVLERACWLCGLWQSVQPTSAEACPVSRHSPCVVVWQEPQYSVSARTGIIAGGWPATASPWQPAQVTPAACNPTGGLVTRGMAHQALTRLAEPISSALRTPGHQMRGRAAVAPRRLDIRVAFATCFRRRGRGGDFRGRLRRCRRAFLQPAGQPVPAWTPRRLATYRPADRRPAPLPWLISRLY